MANTNCTMETTAHSACTSPKQHHFTSCYHSTVCHRSSMARQICPRKQPKHQPVSAGIPFSFSNYMVFIISKYTYLFLSSSRNLIKSCVY
ncbi:hypothetical protein ASPBRDRAFT_230011 [Aspergillus brasiliensis CBS 101740]|uniref:Uncharacterized protein n=1 Tax=Aspergillus brasiliensis (strain CBS 101740 / IMI 381727 / IBT 21946) TaxID=767769 RepID=A0A1L9UZR5_ASPBC|nr:hypothetical protein ASPBRDRAFT_230011 [Aspergillus brasiliensis CBS 101740]